MNIKITENTTQKEGGLYKDTVDGEIVLFGGEWNKVVTFGKVGSPHPIPYLTNRSAYPERFQPFKGTVVITS